MTLKGFSAIKATTPSEAAGSPAKHEDLSTIW